MTKTIVLLSIIFFILSGCAGTETETNATASKSEASSNKGSNMQNTEAMINFSSLDELSDAYTWQDGQSGITYFDVVEGDGREVLSGDWIAAFYTLWDAEGNLLQTNSNDKPFVIEVGVGNLIKGWDVTVPGMKDGGIRRLIVPGDMAYGETPPPGIKPNATLVFELEIVASGTKRQ
jgi:FKBP-type peptidyl-prolyl cis-trans isomerase